MQYTQKSQVTFTLIINTVHGVTHSLKLSWSTWVQVHELVSVNKLCRVFTLKLLQLWKISPISNKNTFLVQTLYMYIYMMEI